MSVLINASGEKVWNYYTQPGYITQWNHRLEDRREVEVVFSENGQEGLLEQEFDPETSHSLEMQKNGWLAILHSFKSIPNRINRFLAKLRNIKILKFMNLAVFLMFSC